MKLYIGNAFLGYTDLNVTAKEKQYGHEQTIKAIDYESYTIDPNAVSQIKIGNIEITQNVIDAIGILTEFERKTNTQILNRS